MQQNYYDNTEQQRQQKDMVLAVNEFCYVQTKTSGEIRVHVGPTMFTVSQQEALVVFDQKSKKFEEVRTFEAAKQLFVSAPIGWYIVLKNPTLDKVHPEKGKANPIPSTLKIGTKENISGPTSFALYPGQMAKVIRGHRLRSNQYLIARVYDAETANKAAGSATVLDAEGKEVEITKETYYTGQLLVIKGTDVSFYIPPTGIEIIPQTAYADDYVREAITLERLEYAILKDEDGEKRYVHGPAVVFPKPTETFIVTPNGSSIFRALELSPISGIYIKVIAEYDEEVEKDGKKMTIHHPIGEELFITGNEQMIYYPRPEHAMIQYDGKYMHHAIAIPEGEGRYILNRLTGKINTVLGPKMYLPDPRKEIIVRRILTPKECELFYPGNKEVLAYNKSMNERNMERLANSGNSDKMTDKLNNAYSTANQESALAIFEVNANISRGTSYTKPRTIALETHREGVVDINVWTSYAVNVISKTGKREVVVGPATRLLDYDETLEALELSTGRPKNTDNMLRTAYLRINNNKVTDQIEVQTKDYVNVTIKLSYDVDFLEQHKDKWFNVNNYVKLLCDKEKSLLKREAKKYTIEEFYSNSTDIIRNIVLNLDSDKKTEDKRTRPGRFFSENGMLVYDCEVLNVMIERGVAELFEKHQNEIVKTTLELSEAEKRAKMVEKLSAYEKQEMDLKDANIKHKESLDQARRLEQLKNNAEIEAKKRAEAEAAQKAKADMQKLIDVVAAAELERARKADDEKIKTEKALAEVEKAKQTAYADTVAKIMKSVEPGLIEALLAKANADMLSNVTEAMSPIAIANGESISTVTNRLLRGTTLESLVETLGNQKIK